MKHKSLGGKLSVIMDFPVTKVHAKPFNSEILNVEKLCLETCEKVAQHDSIEFFSHTVSET